MRLLELGRNASDAEAMSSILLEEPVEIPVKTRYTRKSPTVAEPAPKIPRVFPIHKRPQPRSAPRKPINLEQLQQRIEVLERRIQVRLQKQHDAARREDLEQLLARMHKLEQRIETELWTARQREHTLLELLARPPLKSLLLNHARQLCIHVPHACWRGFKAFGKEWWQDCQPLWWPKFAAAWQEALERARS